MSDAPIFSVTNKHAESCGTPPRIDDATPSRYLGYFENEHSEQAMFVYERATGKGTLHLGDAGWEHPYAVLHGAVPGLILGSTELAWLAACWRAATARALVEQAMVDAPDEDARRTPCRR